MGIIIGISIFIVIVSIVFWKYKFRPGTDEFEKLFHGFYDKEDDKEEKK